MTRPVVIISPLCGGVELAPLFKARGIPCIAVDLSSEDWLGYGSSINKEDFIEIFPADHNLESRLRQYNPLVIIAGEDSAVPLAEKLCAKLTPQFANKPEKAIHRTHKAHMQDALVEAGIPALKTFSTTREEDAQAWIEENSLTGEPLIIKPPASAGSDNVFYIPANDDWRDAFQRVLTEPSKINGEKNQSVVLQEFAAGTEFAVGTVSVNGEHYLSHLIQYNKVSMNGRDAVYDHVEFIPFDEDKHTELWQYTQSVLDSLGMRFGANHTEIMLTEKGPRLIETSARICGGPVVRFSRKATGSSQADKLVELFLDGEIKLKSYQLTQTVMPVFLRSPQKGRISNTQVLDEISQLPSLFESHLWFEEGSEVPQTVDYITNLGIVALTGDKEQITEDYNKIRTMESQLHINAV